MMVDGVIKDEDIDTVCAGERFKCGFYDGGSEHCCESAPMDVAGIHEAVEGVLGKGDRTGLLYSKLGFIASLADLTKSLKER